MTTRFNLLVDREVRDVWLRLYAYVWGDAVHLSNHGDYGAKLELIAHFGVEQLQRMHAIGLINWDPETIVTQPVLLEVA